MSAEPSANGMVLEHAMGLALNIAVYTPSATRTAENLLAGDHKAFYNWNELNPDKNVAAAAMRAVAAVQVFPTLFCSGYWKGADGCVAGSCHWVSLTRKLLWFRFKAFVVLFIGTLFSCVGIAMQGSESLTY